MSDAPIPVKWGILGAAKIAGDAIIPGLNASDWSTPYAIGARDLSRAQAMADKHGISKAYGSYEEVLADPDVEVIYIALPNHLHISWAKKAADSGKHVLIEKPGAMTAQEYSVMDDVDPELKISEAFMVRQQPRWIKLRELLRSEQYGRPMSFSSLLSFTMENTDDFRQKPELGGGAYYDQGCYTAMAARYIFDAEPVRVFAAVENNSANIDVFTSVIMDFGQGRFGTFTVSLAQALTQTVQVVCEKAFISLPQAFVPSQTEVNRILIDTSVEHENPIIDTLEFPGLDQYEEEVTNFSKAVRGEEVAYFDLQDARANAKVCDSVFASAKAETWVAVK